jgi:hypothetical protein
MASRRSEYDDRVDAFFRSCLLTDASGVWYFIWYFVLIWFNLCYKKFVLLRNIVKTFILNFYSIICFFWINFY